MQGAVKELGVEASIEGRSRVGVVAQTAQLLCLIGFQLRPRLALVLAQLPQRDQKVEHDWRVHRNLPFRRGHAPRAWPRHSGGV